MMKEIWSRCAVRTVVALLIMTVACTIYINQGATTSMATSVGRFPRSVIEKSNKSSNNSSDPYRKQKVWIASTVSVFIISAIGLAGVAVVPLVHNVFFNKIIQYLVALAVGTLTGDAFLHLLPHAILGGHADKKDGHEGDNEEFKAVMKGLVALCGIYFFFFAEKCFSMISDYRTEKKAEEEENQRQIADPRRSDIRRMSVSIRSRNSSGNRRGSHVVGNRESAMYRRLSKIPPLATDEDNIMTMGLGAKAMKTIDSLVRFADLDTDNVHTAAPGAGNSRVHYFAVPRIHYDCSSTNNYNESDQIDSEMHKSEASINQKAIISENDRESSYKNNSVNVCKKLSAEEECIVQTRANRSDHGHNHSHEVPASIAAVAWMVILGDGLHNFTDGLAIGVAFADNISGGISTAIAVFCHELPHELGDFAVLLKTGMKVRQALFYNIVSSVLCFLGMFIGIGLNNIDNAITWIFAVTAGIFVYIALVDMLPELSNGDVRLGESRIIHLLIQGLGLMSGVGIMLVIAIFEDNIKSILGDK